MSISIPQSGRIASSSSPSVRVKGKTPLKSQPHGSKHQPSKGVKPVRIKKSGAREHSYHSDGRSAHMQAKTAVRNFHKEKPSDGAGLKNLHMGD